MGPRLRKLTHAVHITVSVTWIGAVVAYVPLDVTVGTSQDAATLRAAWFAMNAITTWAIVPLA